MIRASTAPERDWAPVGLSWPRGPWPGLLLAALLVAGLGAAAVPLGERALAEWHGPGATPVEPRQWPARPLPSEWRWSPAGVDLEGMIHPSER